MRGRFKKRNVSSPRCVFLWSTNAAELWFAQNTNCIAVCKINCLQTRSIPDGSYETSTLDHCKYPNTILSECRIISEEIEQQQSDPADPHQDLEACHHLYVTEDYLKNYTFFDEEVVWIRGQERFPLERVVLRPSEDCCPELTTDQKLKEILSQLSDQCPQNVVLVQRHFKFLHQVLGHQAVGTTTPSLSEEELFYHTSSEWTLEDVVGGDDLPPPASFDVLDTTPLLQGCISSTTNIIIVPPTITGPAPSPSVGDDTLLKDRNGAGDGPCASPCSDTVSEDSNVCQEQDGTLVHRERLQRLMSLSSASDIRIEDSEDGSLVRLVSNEKPSSSPIECVPPTGYQTATPYVFPDRPPHSPVEPLGASYGSAPYGTPPITSDPPQFIIEGRGAPGYRLRYHFVMLPRQLAMSYDIYGLQNVLITTVSAGPAHRRYHTHLGDLVLPLNNELGRGKESVEERRRTRQHLAIVHIYDSFEDLENYVPQIMLGRRYRAEDRKIAYLHPEMLFGLFPETLSTAPRRYMIKIEVREGGREGKGGREGEGGVSL